MIRLMTILMTYNMQNYTEDEIYKAGFELMNPAINALDEEIRRSFIITFIERFIDRDISYETSDVFRLKLHAQIYQTAPLINQILKNASKIGVASETITKSNRTNKDTGRKSGLNNQTNTQTNTNTNKDTLGLKTSQDTYGAQNITNTNTKEGEVLSTSTSNQTNREEGTERNTGTDTSTKSGKEITKSKTNQTKIHSAVDEFRTADPSTLQPTDPSGGTTYQGAFDEPHNFGLGMQYSNHIERKGNKTKEYTQGDPDQATVEFVDRTDRNTTETTRTFDGRVSKNNAESESKEKWKDFKDKTNTQTDAYTNTHREDETINKSEGTNTSNNTANATYSEDSTINGESSELATTTTYDYNTLFKTEISFIRIFDMFEFLFSSYIESDFTLY